MFTTNEMTPGLLGDTRADTPSQRNQTVVISKNDFSENLYDKEADEVTSGSSQEGTEAPSTSRTPSGKIPPSSGRLSFPHSAYVSNPVSAPWTGRGGNQLAPPIPPKPPLHKVANKNEEVGSEKDSKSFQSASTTASKTDLQQPLPNMVQWRTTRIALEKQRSFDEKPSEQTEYSGYECTPNVYCRCKKGRKTQPNQDAYLFQKYPGEVELFGVFDGHGKEGHFVSQFVKERISSFILEEYRKGKNLEKMQKEDAKKTPMSIKQVILTAFRRTQRALEDRERWVAQQGKHAQNQGNYNSTLGENQQPEPLWSSHTSGSTATITLRESGSKDLYIAHVGDSRAIILHGQKKGASQSIVPCVAELTKDHKPDQPEERKRIEKSGGEVIFDGWFNHRVFVRNEGLPGLNMSRAMGDLLGSRLAGIGNVPDVRKVKLDSDFIGYCLCSDGVWEFMSNKEVARLILAGMAGSGENTGSLEDSNPAVVSGIESMGDACEAICGESWSRWVSDSRGEVVDDITCCIRLFGEGDGL